MQASSSTPAGTCGGVWLDRGELETIVSRKSRYTTAEAVVDLVFDPVPGLVRGDGPDPLWCDPGPAGDYLDCILEFIGDVFSVS